MCLVRKYFWGGRKSEDGFVLVAALLAMLIMIALGFYALSTTTQDMRTSSHIVAERKAFSAAECGLHALCLTFDAGNPAASAVTNGACDATNDPNCRYDIDTPQRDPAVPSINVVGADLTGGKKWSSQVWKTTITGKDTSYNSSVSVAVGVTFGPVPEDPSYH